MKSILAVLFCFFLYQVEAQDTIVDQSGKTMIVKVLSMDKTAGLIIYVNGQDTLIHSISSLQKYPSSPIQTTTFTPSNLTINPTVNEFNVKMSRKYPNYHYSKWSAGINLMALLSPSILGDYDFLENSYATNRSFDLYVQYELKSKLALRFPVRIGIQPLNHTHYTSTYLYYGVYSRELIAAVGFEPLIYMEGLRQFSWYLLPSVNVGLGRKVLNVYNYPATNYYQPKGNASHVKIAASVGFQANVTRTVQFGMETGLYWSNNYWLSSGYSPQAEPYRSKIVGLSLKLFATWRFGGKKATK